MNEPVTGTPDEAAAVAAESCARCGTRLRPGDRVQADDRAFCRSCHAALRQELEQVVAAMSTDVNYPNALLGAVLGGAAGAALWWGFTALTGISFGLVAVAIGFCVGWATVRFAGGKRSQGLQLLSAGVALVSFFAATYLVNATFINRTLAERHESWRVPLVPPSPAAFMEITALGFGVMDFVFLGIVLWQAWQMPAPVRLPPAEAA